MNNLYIVESPLQALCALEVSLNRENEKHSIIVRISDGSRSRSDQQILEVVNKRKWSNKIIISNSSNFIKNQYNTLKNLLIIEKNFKNKISNLYIGEFRYPFMHLARVAVRANNVYLLDDGAASVKVINCYIDKNLNYPFDTLYPKNKFKSLIFQLIYKRYLDIEVLSQKITVLSAFAQKESQNIKILNFKNIKSIWKSSYVYNRNLVYFFGSKYSEAGIINYDYEITFLTGVKDFYFRRNQEVIYFAHRDESDDKLSFLNEDLGFIVVKPNLIAELYFFEIESLPIEFSGAYTSVLNNLRVIFPEISIRSFRIKSSEINNKHRYAIEHIYEYYNDLDIPIEE